jgi:hypothetical protein
MALPVTLSPALKGCHELLQPRCRKAMYRILHYICVSLLAAILYMVTGCSGTSTFTSYPRKIGPVIDQLSHGTRIDFSQCLLSECRSADLILYSMERGRAAQILNERDISRRDFQASMEKIAINDAKAMISASEVGAQIAAITVNDNAIPYEGEGYERVMLHHFQALNYLKERDIEGAGVEVRRANQEQEFALKRFEAYVDEARHEAREARASNIQTASVLREYAQLDEVAGKVKNSFQNAYTFFLSGVVYELLQQPNDAYIDYKRALEIYPENQYLQQDVMRLATLLDMSDDLADFRARFTTGETFTPAADEGELIVLFEDGFVPRKKEIKLSLPIYNVGFVAIAFPMYNVRWSNHIPLEIIVDDETIGLTEPICDFRALAVKALQEKAPGIVTRQLIRAISKGATANKARQHAGDAGVLLTSIWNIISENADLRSWLTLPANAQILRATLPAGTYPLSLHQRTVPPPAPCEVTILPGGKTLLHVVRAGNRYFSTATSFSAASAPSEY